MTLIRNKEGKTFQFSSSYSFPRNREEEKRNGKKSAVRNP